MSVADSFNIIWHNVINAWHHLGSTHNLGAELVRGSEITAALCCKHLRSKVEPVHEPPVEEGTEIEIDEIVVGKIEVSQLKHPEELQSYDLTSKYG